MSSLGLFVTDEAYVGKNGYSLRLRGLEPGINDHAYESCARHARRRVRESGRCRHAWPAGKKPWLSGCPPRHRPGS
jgi:hypothetical protein